MTEEEELLARIAAAKSRLAAKERGPVIVARALPPGPRALHDGMLSCDKCRRNISKGTRYVLVKRDGRRLRYHEPCEPKEE